MRRHEVYISYAWGGESEIIVTEICQQLQNNKVKYYIDKKDIAYKDSIREFEERLGAGDYVILVVSDKFLKSKDCMYELNISHQMCHLYHSQMCRIYHS